MLVEFQPGVRVGYFRDEGVRGAMVVYAET
jgi:hypothetical protein